MEQWEHMVVRSTNWDSFVDKQDDTVLITDAGVIETVQGTDFQTTIQVLNRLGREGWQVVDTDLYRYNQGRDQTKTYFLKRRIEERPAEGFDSL